MPVRAHIPLLCPWCNNVPAPPRRALNETRNAAVQPTLRLSKVTRSATASDTGALMSTSKHPKAQPGDLPRDDLEDNPGIGASKGTKAGKGDPDLIEGESTFEGDVESDTNPQGGVDPRHVGRTNK